MGKKENKTQNNRIVVSKNLNVSVFHVDFHRLPSFEIKRSGKPIDLKKYMILRRFLTLQRILVSEEVRTSSLVEACFEFPLKLLVWNEKNQNENGQMRKVN